jgi:cytochrome c biogenesis protein CcdA
LGFASLVTKSRNPWRIALAFVAGTLSVYAFFGYAGQVVVRLISLSSWVYAAIAVSAFVGGVLAIIGAEWCPVHEDAEPKRAAVGAAFLSGAGFALVVSPCCTPVVGAVVAYSSGADSGSLAAGLLVAFGLGHLTPVFATLAVGTKIVRRVVSSRLSQAGNVVAGAAMLFISAYYALLI